MTTDRRTVEFAGTKGYYCATGYHSARIAVKEGRTAISGSGQRHYEYDRPKLIDQSREFTRDNGIYRGIMERGVAYIIGNGFKLQVTSGTPSYRKKIEDLWKVWHRRPEVRGLLSGRSVDRMVCREMLTCGDTGILKTKQGLIQHIESEQIVGKGVAFKDGVVKNDIGAPTSYWISPYNPRSGRPQTEKAQQYSPADFIFITEPDRPSSTRGVPPCQSSFPMLHRINDICDSEAIAWQILSKLALSINTDNAAEGAYGSSREDATAASTDLATRITDIDYALLFHANPGESITGIDRNIPGKNFSESLPTFLRLLGLPLGMPLEIILLDWTKSNYSQSRAVLEQAYQTFLCWQAILEDFYYRQVFEWKLNQWAKQKLVTIPKAGIVYDWAKPAFPWIDQLKEAQAYAMKVDRGFTTHSNVCKALNTDRDDVVAVRVMEVTDAIKQAQKIKDDTGVEVPWQMFAGMEAKPTAAPAQPGQDNQNNQAGNTDNADNQDEDDQADNQDEDETDDKTDDDNE